MKEPILPMSAECFTVLLLEELSRLVPNTRVAVDMLKARDAQFVAGAKAEIDRLRELLAQPTEAMVEAAARAIDPFCWDEEPLSAADTDRRIAYRSHARDDARAALVAAGKAMGGDDGKAG